MRERRQEWLEALVTLTVVVVSMYPLYRDDLERARLWVLDRCRRVDPHALEVAEFRREVSEYSRSGETDG
jgi:hypothetical protein